MTEQKRYKNNYYVECCPICKAPSTSVIKKYTGSSGLFSIRSFSHYTCEECQSDFKSYDYITTISKDKHNKILAEIEQIIKDGINSVINSGELIKRLRKHNILCWFIPDYKKKNDRTKRRT